MSTSRLRLWRNELDYFWITHRHNIIRGVVITSAVLLFTVLLLYDSNRQNSEAFVFKSYDHGDYRIPDPKWTYKCSNSICEKTETKDETPVSFQKCNMLCGQLDLWPMPSVVHDGSKQASPLDTSTNFNVEHNVNNYPTESLLKLAYYSFNSNIFNLIDHERIKQRSPSTNTSSSLHIRIVIEDGNVTKLTLKTSEEYELIVNRHEDIVVADVSAATFFGARHALETLSQLIWYDELSNSLMIVHDVTIQDKPAFPYRGLMIDTARNYFSVEAIERQMLGMAANKLNVLHWHMTDAQSFPLQLESFPVLSRLGAYSKDKIYTMDDVRRIVSHGRTLGIRVLIEIDAPSHMFAGWSRLPSDVPFVITSHDDNNGQLNPNNPHVYEILKEIYGEVLNATDNNELFHIGGDEVDLKLWYEKTKDPFDIWDEVLRKILLKLKEANNNQEPDYTILWSSPYTGSQHLLKSLNNDTTIIQYWYGNLNVIKQYGYKVIFSNVAGWYLDCGFGAWAEGRNANCDPYRTWQTFYTHSPWKTVDISNVFGGEACLWSEQIGEASMDTRIWPRTAAFAERVWSNPTVNRKLHIDVYKRLETQRSRLKKRGVQSEVLWPEYCVQNPRKC